MADERRHPGAILPREGFLIMAYNLADILNALTIMQSAARRLITELRKLESESEQQLIREKAKEVADELQAFLDGASLGTITMEALKKLSDAVLAGKSIVQHQSTDIF
jgi:type II secretory pathway component PulF